MVSYQGGAITGFTKFLRDGAAVVYEKSFTISGSSHLNKSEKTYLYGAGRMAVTKDTNLVSGVSTYTYYGVDHLGTVRYSKTINSSGLPVAGGLVNYAFEPFGVMIPGQSASISPNGNTHLYTGQERDTLADGSNMDYMHFRFFSASRGRFQKPDSNFDNPGANPQGWNLYSYVKGNPVNFNDPTGHQSSGGQGPVDGPFWGGSAHRSSNPFEFSAPFLSREGAGTIGSANTFSMLGQTMNPQQATGQAAPKQPQPKVGGGGSGQEAGPKKEGFWHWVGRKLGFIQDDEKKGAAPVSQERNAQATGTNLVVGTTEAAANGAGGTSALSVTAKTAASEGSTGAAGIAGVGTVAAVAAAPAAQGVTLGSAYNFQQTLLVAAAGGDQSAEVLYNCCMNQIMNDAVNNPGVYGEKYDAVQKYVQENKQYPDHW